MSRRNNAMTSGGSEPHALGRMPVLIATVFMNSVNAAALLLQLGAILHPDFDPTAPW